MEGEKVDGFALGELVGAIVGTPLGLTVGTAKLCENTVVDNNIFAKLLGLSGFKNFSSLKISFSK